MGNLEEKEAFHFGFDSLTELAFLSRTGQSEDVEVEGLWTIVDDAGLVTGRKYCHTVETTVEREGPGYCHLLREWILVATIISQMDSWKLKQKSYILTAHDRQAYNVINE